MNGQIDHLIKSATDRVSEQGNESDIRDIMLAGFGYMVHEIRKPKSILEGKKGVIAGASAGGGSVGIIEILLRLFGI